MTTTKTTFADVTETFEQVYEELREANGENAPNSNTWYAPTPDELRESVQASGLSLPEHTTVSFVGSPDGEMIAWVYECVGRRMYCVTDWASENELITLFGRCMGYEL